MEKVFGGIVTCMVAIMFLLGISSCSSGDEPKDDSASFLYATWKWEGKLYELTFLEGGKAFWNYNDDRGTKETSYTYDVSTTTITFTAYRESYKILKVEDNQLQILNLWDNKQEVWTKIVK